MLSLLFTLIKASLILKYFSSIFFLKKNQSVIFKLMLPACKMVSSFLSRTKTLFKLAVLNNLKLTLLISTLVPKSFANLFVATSTSQFWTIAVCTANAIMAIINTIAIEIFPNIFNDFFSIK